MSPNAGSHDSISNTDKQVDGSFCCCCRPHRLECATFGNPLRFPHNSRAKGSSSVEHLEGTAPHQADDGSVASSWHEITTQPPMAQPAKAPHSTWKGPTSDNQGGGRRAL